MSIVKSSDWLRITTTDAHVQVDLLAGPCQVLSSCVLNGGLTEVSHLLNLKVPRVFSGSESPAQTLQNYAAALGCKGGVAGMMTAASMDSFRLYEALVEGVEIVVLVTCGLENARRVGDAAEYRSMVSAPEQAGTINIMVLTSATMTDAAMVEAVQMVTEAKTATLVQAGILSPVSGLVATGTGTDAVAVVSARIAGGCAPQVSFCGKHVLFGEVLGQLVLDAVTDSIGWYQGQ